MNLGHSRPDTLRGGVVVAVDPGGLVRNRQRPGPPAEGDASDQYVNDRPYVASSFLSVARS